MKDRDKVAMLESELLSQITNMFRLIRKLGINNDITMSAFIKATNEIKDAIGARRKERQEQK